MESRLQVPSSLATRWKVHGKQASSSIITSNKYILATANNLDIMVNTELPMVTWIYFRILGVSRLITNDN